MTVNLTNGSVTKSMLLFAVPMILGDLLQQCYNIADTLIVGQFLGKTALAAVGSSFALIKFLNTALTIPDALVFLNFFASETLSFTAALSGTFSI